MKIYACGIGAHSNSNSSGSGSGNGSKAKGEISSSSSESSWSQFRQLSLLAQQRQQQQRPTSRQQPPCIQLIACGWDHIVLITRNNQIWVKGNNHYGQLGLGGGSGGGAHHDNVREHYSDFQLVRPCEGLRNKKIKLLASGSSHVVLVTSDDQIWTCGQNMYGQCGLGHYDDVSSFQNVTIPIDSSTTTTGEAVTIEQVVCGGEHTFIRMSDHSLWACGQGYSGQLGLRRQANECTFVQVNGSDTAPDDNWAGPPTIHGRELKQVACGDNHTVLLTCDNEVWVCGSNALGALGLGSEMGIPDYVLEFQRVVLSGGLKSKNIKSIQCGSQHTILLTEDGCVFSCGTSQHGALCLAEVKFCNVFTQVPIKPVQFSDLAINCSPSNSTIIFTQANELLVCGENKSGNLGLGDCQDRSILHRIKLSTSQDEKIYNIAAGHSMTLVVVGKLNELEEWQPEPESVDDEHYQEDVSVELNSESQNVDEEKELLERDLYQKDKIIEQLEKEKQEMIQQLQSMDNNTARVPISDEALKPWLVNESELRIEEQIGEDYFKGTWNWSPVAIQSLNIHNRDSQVISDLVAIASVRHPNCVQFLGFCEAENDRALIVTELMDRTLSEILDDESVVDLGNEQKLRIAFDIAKGLLHLHTRSHPIYHMGLNSKSILTNSSCSVIKVSGYGLYRLRNVQLSPNDSETNPTASSDIYSYGLLLKELWYRAPRLTTTDHVIPVSPRNQYHFLIVKLIASCIQDNESQRPSFAEVADQLQYILSQNPSSP